jgi:arsenate reductase (thioredoxin)
MNGLNLQLSEYITNIISDFLPISDSRKLQLEAMSEYFTEKAEDGKNLDIIFICTHNSRRSHIAQLWAAVAAEYYEIPNVSTYSGGTEATAFNHRSVKAMQKTGYEIKMIDEGKNPIYQCSFSSEIQPTTAFSKKYDHITNPQSDFIAVMVCSDADEACPFVAGASKRFSLPYDDPKNYDDTELEESKYDERTKQIATEIFYMFSRVKI